MTFVNNHGSRGGRGNSQSKQSEDPDPKLGSQEVPGTSSPAGGGAGLREQFTVPGDQVAVAVDHLATVIHCPAQTTALGNNKYYNLSSRQPASNKNFT